MGPLFQFSKAYVLERLKALQFPNIKISTLLLIVSLKILWTRSDKDANGQMIQKPTRDKLID